MSEESPDLVEDHEVEHRPRTANEELISFMRTERWIMLALLLGATGAAIYFFTRMMKQQAQPVNGLGGFGYPGLPQTNGAFYPIQIINQLPPYLQGAQNQFPLPKKPTPVQAQKEERYCDKCEAYGCHCY